MVGATPLVDILAIITDHAQVSMGLGEKVDEPPLKQTQVLCFVDENVLEFPLVFLAEVGVVGERVVGVVLHSGEVNHVVVVQVLVVSAVDAGEMLVGVPYQGSMVRIEPGFEDELLLLLGSFGVFGCVETAASRVDVVPEDRNRIGQEFLVLSGREKRVRQ